MISNDYICPNCATFNLTTTKGFECSNCGQSFNRRHLKITHDYAKHVYLYGHVYRRAYQNQLDDNGEVSTKFCLTHDEIYKFIGLAMLSGVFGNFAWEIVKNACFKIVESYNKKFKKEYTFSEHELNEIYESFKLFIKSPGQIDKKVMDSIVEEMFAHGAGKHGKKFLKNFLMYSVTDDANEKNQIEIENQKLLKKFSKEVGKKISELQQAEDEAFDNYWGQIKIE